MLGLVVLGIVIALIFDFINGFHDAANLIATVVSTRVLSPMQAVIWAAVFNFVAAFGFGVSVATTIGKGVVRPDAINEYVIMAGLVGAIAWDLITWRYGIPSRSSLIIDRGLAETAIVNAGKWALPSSRPGLDPDHSPLCRHRRRFIRHNRMLCAVLSASWRGAPGPDLRTE